MVTEEMNEIIKKGGEWEKYSTSTEFYSEIIENESFDMVPVNMPCLRVS